MTDTEPGDWRRPSEMHRPGAVNVFKTPPGPGVSPIVGGRPRIPYAVVDQVRQLASEHPDWGCRRIADWLQAQGEWVSVTTVWRIMRRLLIWR